MKTLTAGLVLSLFFFGNVSAVSTPAGFAVPAGVPNTTEYSSWQSTGQTIQTSYGSVSTTRTRVCSWSRTYKQYGSAGTVISQGTQNKTTMSPPAISMAGDSIQPGACATP